MFLFFSGVPLYFFEIAGVLTRGAFKDDKLKLWKMMLMTVWQCCIWFYRYEWWCWWQYDNAVFDLIHSVSRWSIPGSHRSRGSGGSNPNGIQRLLTIPNNNKNINANKQQYPILTSKSIPTMINNLYSILVRAAFVMRN